MTTLSPPSPQLVHLPSLGETAIPRPPFPERHPSCPLELYEARKSQLEKLKWRRLFKAENEIERPARYPLSKRNHFAWLVLVMVVESALNMYFFARGSDLGLFGGWMQAFLLSAANVGGAAAIGYFGVRQIHHIAATRKFLGVAAVVVYLVGAVALNLFAALYRDLLEVTLAGHAAGFTTPWWAIGAFTFDSKLLFTLGMISSALGVHGGYKGDDAYPGYGDVDRDYQFARARFTELRAASPKAEVPFPHVGDEE